ncbi:MAG: hypothetical protein ACOCYO_06005 [Bacteroidota bacterium]
MIKKIMLLFIVTIYITQNTFAEPIDSINIGKKKCYLIQDNKKGYSYMKMESEREHRASGKLPNNEIYATGQSTNSLTEKNDSAFYLYEWNSGMSGGYYEMHIIEKNNLIYADRLNANIDGEANTFSEIIDLNSMNYVRRSSKYVQNGKLMVASAEGNISNKFANFVPIYGGHKIKGKSDLSAAATINHTENQLIFSITVIDDIVNNGTTIHSDHVELWWSESAFDGELNEKPEDNTRQLLVFFDGEKMSSSLGYPEGQAKVGLKDPSYEKLTNGYKMSFRLDSDMIIKSNFLDGEKGRNTIEDGDVLLMTLVVSDSDRSKKQESMVATSELEWGNPSTFGRIVVVKKGQFPLVSQNLFYH